MSYTYEEAFRQSVEYFNGNELAAKVFVDKYALRDSEGSIVEPTPKDMHMRLAGEFARIDMLYGCSFDESYKKYEEALHKFSRIVPQGSPMAAIGNPYQTLSASNCVVIASPGDNMAEIFRAGLNLAQLYKRRCGSGIDISTLRPEGAAVSNAARSTSGAWSFSDFYSYITRMIAIHGRRGALMITISVHHPDVIRFATMKHDLTRVTGANISVRLSDEFMKAVEDDAEYEQRWPCEGTPKIVKKIRAREVWDTIIDSATKYAEPGLMFWDTAIRNLPAHCYPQFKTVTSNPCCFDKDSQITVITKSGLKDIKQITNDDLIWVDEHKTWAKTSGYFDAGKAEVFRLSLSNNDSFCVTGNHKFERLTKSQDENRHVEYSRELVELRELAVGDFLALHKEEVADGGFGEIGNYNDGLIFGWLTGDGCLSFRNESETFPTIYLSFWKDEYDVADKVLEAVNEYGFGLTLSSSNDGYDNIVKRIGSMALCRTLTEKYQINIWKFKNGFNEFLHSASKEFIKGYLSAYFSADGTVASAPTNSRYAVSLSSIDYARLIQVKNLLTVFGINSHIGILRKAGATKIRGREYYNQTCFRLTISGYKNLIKFRDHIGFVSSIKSSRLDQIFENFKSEGRTSEAYAEIKSIESIGVKEIGCIDVDRYHKFTANGVISGNSEILLSEFDSCRLISINLTGYVRKAFEDDAEFDIKGFEQDVRIAMRMADNLVDLELELINKIRDKACSDEPICDTAAVEALMLSNGIPEETVKASIRKISDFSETGLWDKFWKSGNDGRRTGLGTHGLADTLAQLKIKYDSSEAIIIVDKIYKCLRDSAYDESIELAKERGPFPVFDYEKEKDCEFIKRLPEQLKEKMKTHGRRNISILTQAPTGTVSLLSKVGESDLYGVSSGVEPVFRNNYTRRKKINEGDQNVKIDSTDANGDRWHHFVVYHSNLQYYLQKFGPTTPEYFVTSDSIDWHKRISLQAAEQLFIDHSIANTVNLPKGTGPDVVGSLYMQAWKAGLKGITVYVDGSRDGVLIAEGDVRDKKISELESKVSDLEAKILDPFPSQTKSPKRPYLLQSETHKIKVDFGDGNPRNAYVTVSFFPNTRRPYEILVIAPYSGLSEKDLQILELAARTTSMNLRHGLPIQFICEQLDKIGGQYIFSIPTNIARVLRHYIVEGEKRVSIVPVPVQKIEDSETGPTLLLCRECGKRSYRMTGQACGLCENCGFSGCG